MFRESSNKEQEACDLLGHYLWQVVLPALAPVHHEGCQPLFSLVYFLFAKGLSNRTNKDLKINTSSQ